MNTQDIKNIFIEKYKNKEFTRGRGGYDMIEIIGASFIADAPTIFGTPNQDYITKEINWYEKQSTNIYDLDENPPSAWKSTANRHGEINSNYGHLIFSKKYHEQYDNVFYELLTNPESRRATMVYTRPSIWNEYNENGKNDFICTNAVTYYIRDNKLHAVVQMRSNDVWAGYRNDYAWQRFVLLRLMADLSFDGEKLSEGNIHWQVQNLHIYSRHFNLIEKEIENAQ